MKLLHNIKAIAFDLDGTIYFGEKLAGGVIEMLNFLEQKKIRIFYFTNNSVKTRKQIFEKLTRLGIKTRLVDVYNSAYASAIYAKSNNFKKIFCCGSADLKNQFLEEGLSLANIDEIADAVFIGLDVGFDYKQMSETLAVVQKSKCQLIACNIDRNYPVENEVLMPGCGAIVAAIENCSEKKIDFIVGKPSSYMLELLMKDHQITKEEILVVGDSYASDIMMAKNFGCKSILISKNKKSDVETISAINELIK